MFHLNMSCILKKNGFFSETKICSQQKDGTQFSRHLYSKHNGVPSQFYETIALTKCLDLCASARRFVHFFEIVKTYNYHNTVQSPIGKGLFYWSIYERNCLIIHIWKGFGHCFLMILRSIWLVSWHWRVMQRIQKSSLLRFAETDLRHLCCDLF